MAKDKKAEPTTTETMYPESAADPARVSIANLERVECARVKFTRVYDGPGTQKKPNEMVTSRKLRRDSEFEINYIPKLRQFEVIYIPRGADDLPEPWLVPEAQVVRWEPLEAALSRGAHR